jgi:threonine/homoserine/homoserine lactone efflux protein
MGAATADGIYGMIAAFGLSVIIQILFSFHIWLQFVGGVIILYLAIQTIRAVPSEKAVGVPSKSLWGNYLSSFALTLSNPLTILSFVGIFAGLGITSEARQSIWLSLMLVLGVFLGSSFWWLMLSTTVGLIRTRLNMKSLRILNIISGVVLIGFGITALVSVFWK